MKPKGEGQIVLQRIVSLPNFDVCEKRVKAGTASPLEAFIFDNEPAGIEATETFRKELIALLEWTQANEKLTDAEKEL